MYLLQTKRAVDNALPEARSTFSSIYLLDIIATLFLIAEQGKDGRMTGEQEGTKLSNMGPGILRDERSIQLTEIRRRHGVVKTKDPNDLSAGTVAAKIGIPTEQLFKTLAQLMQRGSL